MKYVLPILVTRHKAGGSRLHRVRPLFFAEPIRESPKLERALSLLADDLRKSLRDLLKGFDHGPASLWTFNPDLQSAKVSMVLELRRRTLRLRLHLFSFEALGRRVWFSPTVPELWFETHRGESLEQVATDACTAHFRERERDEEDFDAPEETGDDLSALVMPLELDIDQDQEPPQEPDLRALLGGGGQPDGAEELRRVGRCLDDLHPDGLDRAVLRTREVDELTRLLARPERRAVLLAGPRLAGKTTVLHEAVFRRAEARRQRERFKDEGRTWLLSPQRLISGMSFVGQWESRLLAILAEARKRDHVLYFDDPLGLYQAGQSASSSLSAADVLKPYLERGEVRVVAEATPEALRVLRERDRGLADLFTLLPVQATGEAETVRVLVSVQRQLESAHGARFDLGVLPAVLDLQRRHGREMAFPGKAALFLRRLAVQRAGGRVTRADALAEFHKQTGLALDLIDTGRRLEREQVLEELRRSIIGQSAALEAMADVVGIAKARLNDPGRPLASFLFLGPTGVGKTQAAKAIAAYLFGDAERLLRFDMNEFVAPGSAARLAGTFWQPEGLLTAAVRRQPFAVLLLDEIEKAHPEVFDLLLQVLGEGRLTDALGRTADFTGTLILLTSNLGVREAEATVGFLGGENRAAYEQAAQRFFRPEFFNRLDRVVPFDRLKRDDVERIAISLIGGLLGREGLVRRKCALRIEADALSRIVDRGFDPVLGARALKRAVEKHLAQPIAATLAAGMPETVTILSVYPKGDAVATEVRALAEVPRLPEKRLGPTADVLDGIGAALRRIEAGFAVIRPTGEISAATMKGEHERYFVLKGLADDLRSALSELREAWEGNRRKSMPALPPSARVRILNTLDWGKQSLLAEVASADDIGLYLEELAEGAKPFGDDERQALVKLADEAAVLDFLAAEAGGQHCVLYAWTPSASEWRSARDVSRMHETGLGLPAEEGQEWWSLAREPVELDPAHGLARSALEVRGLAAERLARLEEGTHLFHSSGAGMVPVHVHAWPVEGDAASTVARHEAERREWLAALSRGEASLDDDPMRPGPVVRLHERRRWVDLRTGATGTGTPWVAGLARAALPLPEELRGE
ncbi:MAG: AAA family ATPase [Gemmataceae bacterium]|nr:AAA family ATPase [Gemmataceae bacterium]